MKYQRVFKKPSNFQGSLSFPKDFERLPKRKHDVGDGSIEKRQKPIVIDLTTKEDSNVKLKGKNDKIVEHLNPMIFYARFSHIAEQIFAHLDNKSLSNCREIAKSWQECIDGRKIFWLKIVQKIGAVQTACKNGHSKLAEMLLKKQKEYFLVQNAEKYSTTAFLLACENGHLKLVDLLVNKSYELNINLNAKKSFRRTAFLEACRNGRLQIAELLIQKSTKFNIDLNASEMTGFTPFHMTCLNDHSQIAELLMQKSAEFKIDLNATCNRGITAFHLACNKGHLLLVELFIQKSAELNIKLNAKTTDDGDTAFHYACYFKQLPKDFRLIEMLMQKSIEFNLGLNDKNKYGQTVFHLLCENKRMSLDHIKRIIQNSERYKLDITAKDNEGRTGLQVAEEYGILSVLSKEN